ncbi:MAG: hypothetical protein KDA20_05270 [Phycisphaerales bacterium]|nr:hypothetical protein [Phycisphaerales bacterium]
MSHRRLTLTEYKTLPSVQLSPTERDALQQLHPGLEVAPTVGTTDRYDLTPDQHIGVIATPTLELEIRPKIPMQSVAFMVSYACELVNWSEADAAWAHDVTVCDLVALLLCRTVERATHRGLLAGYRSEQELTSSPRGRIRFESYITRQCGIAPPIEVEHDLFTTDILENRLLLAALRFIGRFPSESSQVQRELGRARRAFGLVHEMVVHPATVPDVMFTRLNEHYRPAISLARVVLQSSSLDLGVGSTQARALLVDMNKVFEEFVRIALRRALGLDRRQWPDKAPKLRLDEDHRVPLKPDLCLVDGIKVCWVGDAKYKRLPSGAYRNADLYQLLAYTIALDLPSGTLIYAADEGVQSATHHVKQSGKLLHVRALQLRARPSVILSQIEAVASEIREASERSALARPRPAGQGQSLRQPPSPGHQAHRHALPTETA